MPDKTDEVANEEIGPIKLPIHHHFNYRPLIRYNHSADNDSDSKKIPRSRRPLSQLLQEFYADQVAAAQFNLQAHGVIPRDIQQQLGDYSSSNEQITDNQLRQMEVAIISKMREYRIRQASEHGPYSEIDWQELVNPIDRMESIIMNQANRHYLAEVQLTCLARSLLEQIEQQNRITSLQRQLNRWLIEQRLTAAGDAENTQAQSKSTQQQDKDLLNSNEASMSELLVQCQKSVQKSLCHQEMFVERLRQVRDRLTYVSARKKEFLRMLKERFAPIYMEYHYQQQQLAASSNVLQPPPTSVLE